MSDAGPRTAADAAAQPLCSLHVAHRSSLPVVGGVVAESADVLGLGAGERSRLRAVVQEVVESIIADAFADGQDVDLDVRVERRPGEMAVVIDDRGAPSSMARGEYPPRIADLVRLGFADNFSAHNQGAHGNRTELTKRLSYSSIAEDEAFTAEAAAEVPVELDAQGEPAIHVRPMEPDDVLGVARLFYRCYGYSAYYASEVYEPERLAEYVRAGRHLATIAITPSGRVVGHVASHVEQPGARTGRIGLLAVDPAYRRLHLSTRIGAVHVIRLAEQGFRGQYTEAVTVHTRSQEVALKSGGHETGLLLAGQRGGLEMIGFDEGEHKRRGVMLMFGFANGVPHRTVYVPKAYQEVLGRIYAENGLDRRIESRSRRQDDDIPAESRFHVMLRHQAGIADLTVEEYGRDFDAALLSQLQELRLNRFDVIRLYLPLGRPETGYFGDGLQELGLSFVGIYPEYEDGDVLVMQSLNNVDPDIEAIHTASPFGQYILDFVAEDLHRAQDSLSRQMRSRTQMARYYEALQ